METGTDACKPAQIAVLIETVGVAKMDLLPAGTLAGAEIGGAAVVLNLFRVSLGTLVGGAGGVALACRYASLSRP
jgi:hypothetical protein